MTTVRLLPLLGLAFLLVLASVPAAEADHFNTDEIEFILAPDAIPAILRVRFADTDYLAPDDLVIGVVIDGDARAYPTRVLNWHEIVDDVVGGVPVAVTYCPLCGTGIVFERTVGGEVLTFKVSGMLYRNNLVMYDEETRTLWPQLSGEGVGELLSASSFPPWRAVAGGVFHGVRLSLRSAPVMAWSEWKALYPETKLLALPRCADDDRYARGGCLNDPYPRDYDSNPYVALQTNTGTLQARTYTDSTGLHPKEFVLGLTLGDVAKAYPYRFLQEDGVVNDEVGGVDIVVTFAAGSAQAFLREGRTFLPRGDSEMTDEAGNVLHRVTGEGAAYALAPAGAVASFWFAWLEFHPVTEVYRIGLVDALEGAGPADGGDSFPLWILVPLVAGAAVVLLALRRRRGRGRRAPPAQIDIAEADIVERARAGRDARKR
jgi:hypothetical protein